LGLRADGRLQKKGEPMLGGGRRRSWRCAFAAGALAALSWPVAYAKDSAGYVKEAQQYIIQGNLKAAEIQLRNAIREAPQDPLPRARLADVYLQLDDSLSAEREARAARERNGNEADYLPVLADALLRQEKFADLMDLVQPGGTRSLRAKSGPRSVLRPRACTIRPRPKRCWAKQSSLIPRPRGRKYGLRGC